MTFFKNPEYQPFFASVGETFLMIVAIQLILNLFGYNGYFFDQRGLYVAMGCLLGYLFGAGIWWLYEKYQPF